MSFLRSLNAHFLVLAIFPLALMFRVLAPNSKSSTHPKNINGTALRVVLQHIHTALNICLFPPLFFFSGLYYTDVASTAFVLLTYVVSKRCSNAVPANFSILLHWAAVIACGGAALFFRQTNIFWVAIFPAGLAAIGRIKARIPQKAKPLVPQDQSFHSIIVDSWNGKLVYDPVINDAVYQGRQKSFQSVSSSVDVVYRLSKNYTLYRVVSDCTTAGHSGYSHPVWSCIGKFRRLCCVEWWRCPRLFSLHLYSVLIGLLTQI